MYRKPPAWVSSLPPWRVDFGYLGFLSMEGKLQKGYLSADVFCDAVNIRGRTELTVLLRVLWQTAKTTQGVRKHARSDHAGTKA